MINTSLLTHTARHTQLAQNLLLIKARNLFAHLSSIHSLGKKGESSKRQLWSSQRWPINIINSFDGAKFSFYTPPQMQHHSLLESNPPHSSKYNLHHNCCNNSNYFLNIQYQHRSQKWKKNNDNWNNFNHSDDNDKKKL